MCGCVCLCVVNTFENKCGAISWVKYSVDAGVWAQRRVFRWGSLGGDPGNWWVGSHSTANVDLCLMTIQCLQFKNIIFIKKKKILASVIVLRRKFDFFRLILKAVSQYLNSQNIILTKLESGIEASVEGGHQCWSHVAVWQT